MLYLQLFWEFFKTGLFAVGGGLATLPFLQDMAERTGWFTHAQLADMLAVSESTPGPIGVNMATGNATFSTASPTFKTVGGNIARAAADSRSAASATPGAPASSSVRAVRAPVARAVSAAAGLIRDHTSGSARATMAGAKLKNAPTTGPGPTAPSGAARPAK